MPNELIEISEDYVVAAEKGLSAEKDCLKMHPSFLSEKISQHNNSSILAVDIGGTNIRIALFRYDTSKNKLEIADKVSVFETKNAYKQGDLTGFIKYINDYIEEYCSKLNEQVDWIGVSYSFPSDIIKVNNHLDVTRANFGKDSWGKGYVITESEVNITAELRNDLKKRGVQFNKWTALNDVIALKLAEVNALAALVVGTGFNLAVMGPDKYLYNTQSSRFTNKLIEDNYYWLNDPFYSQYGISEVQISGRYLYKRFIDIIKLSDEYDQNFVDLVSTRKSEVISLVLADNFTQMEEYKGSEISHSERMQYKLIADALLERSTDLASAELSGAIKFSLKHNPDYNKSKIVVNTDGSVIRKMPNYYQKILNKTSGILATEFELRIVEDSGIYGAAYASLLNS